MPSFAVLGATGQVGQALIQLLLQSTDNSIHAYCRSETKLQQILPETRDSNQVRVFSGELTDEGLLDRCLAGTRAAFLVIAPPENTPGCQIVQDAAKAVIESMERLRKDQTQSLPRLVILSSASVEPRLMTKAPPFLLTVLHRAFSHTYADLAKAEAFVRSKSDWVNATFVMPGAISHDTQKGHKLSMEDAISPISFLDLAAGMIEIAMEESARYNMKDVAVNSAVENVAFPKEAPWKIASGLWNHYFSG